MNQAAGKDKSQVTNYLDITNFKQGLWDGMCHMVEIMIVLAFVYLVVVSFGFAVLMMLMP